MKSKQVVTLILLLVIIVTGFSIYSFRERDSGKSDEEIKKMFDCNRVTADIRATDVYCRNPELYREHLRQGKVLKPTDSLQ